MKKERICHMKKMEEVLQVPRSAPPMKFSIRNKSTATLFCPLQIPE
jgi:hypothetical protein